MNKCTLPLMESGYRHICPSYQWIRYTSMESRDSNELYGSGGKKTVRSSSHAISDHPYDANDDRIVCRTSNTKKPVDIGGFGNHKTIKAATRAKKRRGQKA